MWRKAYNKLFNYPTARYYQDACTKQPKDYSDYANFTVQWGFQDDYQIVNKIGQGKYSEVFQGINILTEEYVVIKVLKPVRLVKIQREMKILNSVKGGPNIIQAVDFIKDFVSHTPSIVLEWQENTDFRILFPTLTLFEIKFYIYELLKALDYAHSRGIMHRDIKPNNLMIDHKQKTLKLIDWGLAEFYIPGTQYHNRVATRYFKGPELLVNNRYYDYSLDMWSLGAMLAGMIFKNEPFFAGIDNNDQLVKIVKILGTEKLQNYLKKYSIRLDSCFDGLLENHQPQPWSRFITQDNMHLVTDDGLDFLDKCLQYDHEERISALEAMGHLFFKEIVEFQRTQKQLNKEKQNNPVNNNFG